jgi:ABC-2 type transport system permease protein
LLGSAWILPVGSALRFTNAEIQFLFTAPCTRRQLLGFKLSRMLLAAAGSGAFLTVFVGPTRLAPAMFFAAKSAVVMLIITLHGAGIATYRSLAKEAGRLRAGRWSIVATACLLTPLAAAGLVFLAWSSPMRFVAALPFAAAIVGINVLWIVRTDNAFEDAALETADKMQRALTSGQVFVPRSPRKRVSRFRLAPRGRVEPAILWKNWMLLGRGSRAAVVTAAVMLAVLIGTFFFASDGDLKTELIGDLAMFVVVLTVLLGPAMLRIDLRQDLAHLALIKTWPVRGATLIRGELLAPAIALSLAATVAVVIGSAVAPELLLVERADAAGRVMFAVAAMMATTAVIVAQLVVHNGLAVYFPAWVELKVTPGSAAMEMNVRMMIVMYGSMLILTFAALLPAAAAFVAYFITGGVLIPSVVFAALLTCESVVAIEILGRVLDRTDLQDVVVSE